MGHFTTLYIFILTFREKEEVVTNLDTKLKEHTKESEHLIEEFRVKAEENSNQMFDDLNSKVISHNIEYTKTTLRCGSCHYSPRKENSSI